MCWNDFLLGLGFGATGGILFCSLTLNNERFRSWWKRVWCRHELVYGQGMVATCKKCDYWEH